MPKSKKPKKECIYAISLKFDTSKLSKAYGGPSWWNAYQLIERALKLKGLERQGRLYVGKPGLTASECVAAVVELSAKFPWFGRSVEDIRMLKIEVGADLLPVLSAASL